MKQKDLAMIILISGIAAIFAFFLSNMFLASDKQLETEVEVVEPISAEFTQPDQRYLNDRANNPTQLIRIEDNKNQNPFQ